MDLWTEIDELRHAWNVLEHPVYRRLTAGSLPWAELAACVGQYRFVLDALADASRYAAGQIPGPGRTISALRARERLAFMSRWDAFADEIGAGGLRPTAATVECAATWRGTPRRDPIATAVTLYAIESAQPAITFAALRALEEHYRVRRHAVIRPLATSARRDGRNARTIRTLLGGRLDPRRIDRAELLSHAEAAYSAHWELLDGCPEAGSDVLSRKSLSLAIGQSGTKSGTNSGTKSGTNSRAKSGTTTAGSRYVRSRNPGIRRPAWSAQKEGEEQ